MVYYEMPKNQIQCLSYIMSYIANNESANLVVFD